MSASSARRFAALLVLVLTAAALAVSRGAQADIGAPLLDLDTISVENGVAVVSGTIDTDGLEVNGVPVVVDASGRFTAVVDLNGDDAAVTVSFVGEAGEDVLIRVPLAVLGSGGSADGILEDLFGSGTTVVVPPDGFQIVDGQMPSVEGSVLRADKLASLEINGKEILSLLGPGGSFSIVPSKSSTDTVVVTATDRSGVSQTSTFKMTSAIGTRTATSVSAAAAKGIRIASISIDRSKLRSLRQLKIVATVKDLRGLRIRDAAVRLTGSPGRFVVNGPVRAGFTNKLGKVTFRLGFKKTAFAPLKSRPFALLVRAKTPTAAAAKRAYLRLPAGLRR
jgi:hypothetical protein